MLKLKTNGTSSLNFSWIFCFFQFSLSMRWRIISMKYFERQSNGRCVWIVLNCILWLALQMMSLTIYSFFFLSILSPSISKEEEKWLHFKFKYRIVHCCCCWTLFIGKMKNCAYRKLYSRYAICLQNGMFKNQINFCFLFSRLLFMLVAHSKGLLLSHIILFQKWWMKRDFFFPILLMMSFDCFLFRVLV